MLIRNLSLWKVDKLKSNLQVPVKVMICDIAQWKCAAIESFIVF